MLQWSSSSSSFVKSKAMIDLFQPHIVVSSKVFVFIHLVYNSASFSASSYCSFFACCCQFDFIFLVSCQLVLLSTLPKFLNLFVVRNGVPGCSCGKFHLTLCQLLFILFSKHPNFTPIWKNRESQCIIYFHSWKLV
jgi:hypothetical protein